MDNAYANRWTGNRFFTPVILAVGIGTMMAAGMAGSDRLEIWIRVSFLLWLLSYIAYSASALIRNRSRAGWALTVLLGAGLAPGVIAVLGSKNQKYT